MNQVKWMWYAFMWCIYIQPVVNEFYDEFVFNEPTEYMYQLYPFKMNWVVFHHTLMTPMTTPSLPSESMYWTAFNESDSLAIIMRAQNYINEELIRMIEVST